MSASPRINRAKVIDMVAAGATNVEIAAALECSGSTVTKLRLSLGLAPAGQYTGDWNAIRVESLKKWWEVDGLTASQITAKFGGMFTRNGVLGKIHREKMKPRGSPIGRTGPNARGLMQTRLSRATDAERKHGVGSNTFLFGAKSAAAQTTPQPKAQLVPAVPPKMRDRVESGTIAERPPIVPTGRAEFRALAGSRLCMWIEGQTVLGSAHLAMTCGAATEPGCPWCARHRARAWNGFKSPAQEAA